MEKENSHIKWAQKKDKKFGRKLSGLVNLSIKNHAMRLKFVIYRRNERLGRRKFSDKSRRPTIHDTFACAYFVNKPCFFVLPTNKKNRIRRVLFKQVFNRNLFIKIFLLDAKNYLKRKKEITDKEAYQSRFETTSSIPLLSSPSFSLRKINYIPILDSLKMI